MDVVNIILCLFGGVILLLNSFSTILQRMSVPSPLAALVFGIVVGPYGLDVITLEAFGMKPGVLLEETARITLAIALTGVALRLPHGYWSRNRRWIIPIIALGMACMWAVATGLIWAFLDISFVLALLIGAIVTPTDPVASTPIVTGSVAEEHIPSRVRYNISSESGINDGLAYLFVFLPLLLLTESTDAAWREWFAHVLLREVLGACLLGVICGFLVGKLFLYCNVAQVNGKVVVLGVHHCICALAPRSLQAVGHQCHPRRLYRGSRVWPGHLPVR